MCILIVASLIVFQWYPFAKTASVSLLAANMVHLKVTSFMCRVQHKPLSTLFRAVHIHHSLCHWLEYTVCVHVYMCTCRLMTYDH